MVTLVLVVRRLAWLGLERLWNCRVLSNYFAKIIRT